MLKTILAIACGGAIGALLRHGVNVALPKMLGADFPWSTLTVNVAGSFAIGVAITMFAHVGQPGQEIKLFLVTGLLGAFTTFSAFSLDFAVMWERGAALPAFGYVLASVILSISALFAAMALVRHFVS